MCTDWRCVLHYISAVGEVGEDGVHVLNISDGNRQISQTRERTPFILVLLQRKTSRHVLFGFGIDSIIPQCRALQCVFSNRGINSELIGGCRLIVQRSRHSNDSSGPINGEERRGRLEGEEHTAAHALIRVCRVHHEHRRSHWSVLFTQRQ